MAKQRGRKASPNNWGDRLAKVMSEKNLSLRQVAKLAGVSSSSVIDSWLNSATPNDLMAISKLCKALNVSFKWLLTGEAEEKISRPAMSEIFQEIPFFDGLARIRIDRLIPTDEMENDK